MRVLVTGAGGPAGVCVIKILKEMDGKYDFVMGMDIDPLAPGLYLADKGILGPRADDKELIPKIIELAKKEKIDAIIPTVQEELIHFARYKRIFEKEGIALVISNEHSLETSNNKGKTYTFFKGESFCPKLYDRSNVKFPAVIKPMDSRGGRGFYKVENEDELRVFLAKNDRAFGKDNSVIMEFLPGTEYSTYGFSDLKGKALAAVPIKRIQANGTSTKAEVVRNPKVEKVAKRIAEMLKLQGPWNIQLMQNGESIKLVEVNPRFAGTTTLADYAGLRMADLAIKLFSGQKIAANELKYRTGIHMTRYHEEKMVETNGMVR